MENTAIELWTKIQIKISLMGGEVMVFDIWNLLSNTYLIHCKNTLCFTQGYYIYDNHGCTKVPIQIHLVDYFIELLGQLLGSFIC